MDRLVLGYIGVDFWIFCCVQKKKRTNHDYFFQQQFSFFSGTSPTTDRAPTSFRLLSTTGREACTYFSARRCAVTRPVGNISLQNPGSFFQRKKERKKMKKTMRVFRLFFAYFSLTFPYRSRPSPLFLRVFIPPLAHKRLNMFGFPVISRNHFEFPFSNFSCGLHVL